MTERRIATPAFTMHAHLILPLAVSGLVFAMSPTRTFAADICDLVAKNVPAALGSAAGKVMRSGNDGCSVASVDGKSLLSAVSLPSQLTSSSMRKTAQENGKVQSEPSLGADAFSQRDHDGKSVKFFLFSGGKTRMVMLGRGGDAGGVTDADVAKGREFAKAVSKQ